MMVSRVQGPLEEGTAGNPGTRQAKMRNCSSAQLSLSACSHSRKRRIPSQRIWTRGGGISSQMVKHNNVAGLGSIFSQEDFANEHG